MKRKVVKKKTSKFIKLIYTLAILMLVSFPIVSITTKAFVSKLNFAVEELKSQKTKHEKTNQSLTMKINELASLENIQAVAKEYGLEYNNDNRPTVYKYIQLIA